jgi:steroid delta-isomerase-like uncharacterized protein
MTPEKNKQIVVRFNKEGIEGKNISVFEELLADNFTNHSAPPGIQAGRDGMVAFFKTVLWESLANVTVEIHDQVAEDDKVVTRKTIHGIHVGEFFGYPASNKKLQLHIMEIVKLLNGQYIEQWRIWDIKDVDRQITEPL